MTLPPSRPELPLCGREPDCLVRTGRWPECVKRPDAMHPALAAEQVCSHALARHINMHRMQHNVYSDLCTALDAVEFGLSLPEQPDEAVRFFDFAEQTFAEIPERTTIPQHIVMARLGTLFVPAFRSRYEGEALRARDIATIHTGIVDTLRMFDTSFTSRHADHFGGLKTELVVLALFSRLGQFDWLAYPATPREEHSAVDISFNHDSYVMLHGTKVPIQAKRKSGRGYDKTVAVVKFADILRRVNRKREEVVIQQWGNKRKMTRKRKPLDYNDFTNLLLREVGGPALDTHERELLTIGSMAAVAEVMEKYQLLRSPELEPAA